MIDLINAIFFPLMWGPLVWEISDDWKADTNKKADVGMRAVLMVAVAAAYAVVHMVVNDVAFYWYFPRGLAMTFACFLLVFNYAMAARFTPDRDWFTYLGNSPVDNFEREHFPPLLRLVIRYIIFSLASVWYW